MRAALYLRVSTTDQTTENQERELRAAADRLGSRDRRGLPGPRHLVAAKDARSGRLSTSSTAMPRCVSSTS